MTGSLRAAAVVAALTLSACMVATEAPRSSPQGAQQAAPQRSYAEESCLAAVASQLQLGNADVSIIWSEVSEGDGLLNVYVNARTAAAPWLCRTTQSGSVRSVEYTAEG